MPNLNRVLSDQENKFRELALHVYRYARRYVVSESESCEDAVIYDACLSVFSHLSSQHPIGATTLRSASEERFLKYGKEPMPTTFAIPVDIESAVVLLHRYARRYTNGRGTFTAALVNDAARALIQEGVNLQETQALDGTVWAADGADGAHDGLSPEEREEALSIIHPQKATP